MVLYPDIPSAEVLILKPLDADDRLGDFLKRLPEDKKIRIGCRAGYIFEGTAGGYWKNRKRIIRNLMEHNKDAFQRAVQGYVRENKKPDAEQKVLRNKFRVLMDRYDYVVNFTPLDYRKVIEAYPLPTDPSVLVFRIEGEEYSAGSTHETRKRNLELKAHGYDTEGSGE